MIRHDGPMARALAAQGTDDCIPWSGHVGRNGYGQASDGAGHVTTAHRRVWLVLGGLIPDAWHLDHLCRNRACVNVRHLEPVTAGALQLAPRSSHERSNSHMTITPGRSWAVA